MIKRPPDQIIGDNYMHRWYVIPRNRWLNIYLHKYYGSDDARAYHDHPWHSVSFLLSGILTEVRHCKKLNRSRVRIIKNAWPVFRRAKFAHRIELFSDTATTLFITGPKVREWGFHCPQGWSHWREFFDPTGNKVSRGCD